MVLKVSNRSAATQLADRNTATRARSSREPEESSEQVEVFRALADPIRLEMVRMMSQQGEVACTAFLERFHVTKSTISYHVRILRTAHLVRIRKDGPWYFYQLTEPGFEAGLPGLLQLLSGDHAGTPARTRGAQARRAT
jgi:ArsR family transcriptional regulator, arsenate/arsenite/antimonite-responsive transcriptional repressor